MSSSDEAKFKEQTKISCLIRRCVSRAWSGIDTRCNTWPSNQKALAWFLACLPIFRVSHGQPRLKLAKEHVAPQIQLHEAAMRDGKKPRPRIVNKYTVFKEWASVNGSINSAETEEDAFRDENEAPFRILFLFQLVLRVNPNFDELLPLRWSFTGYALFKKGLTSSLGRSDQGRSAASARRRCRQLFGVQQTRFVFLCRPRWSNWWDDIISML